MTFDSWYTNAFRETLGETLAESDGIPDHDLSTALGGRTIPEAMRAYYRVAGKHWLNTNHNQLRSAELLESIDGHTIFMVENQVVAQWAIRDVDSSIEDPIVYQGQLLENGYEWYSKERPFSQFIVAMWRWTLTGEEPA